MPSRNPDQRLAGAYGAIFFVGGLSIAIGLLAEMGVTFLQRLGQGIYSIISGVLFLILGYFVKQRSMAALVIAVGAYVIDGILYFKHVALQAGPSISGGVLFRLFLLFFMVRGFSAISAAQEQELTPPALSSIPKTSPVASRVTPEMISFVAPANSGEIEKKRLEMRQAETQSRVDRQATVSALSVDLRVKPVSADFAAAALRHLVYRCEVSARGLRAVYSSGKQREMLWSDFCAAVIRQLPPDPPWESKIMFDFLPQRIPGQPVIPIRLFSTTFVNYADLPQGASPSSQENMRRLAHFASIQNPSIAMDNSTLSFVQAGKSPLRFANVSQFAEYDSRYS